MNNIFVGPLRQIARELGTTADNISPTNNVYPSSEMRGWANRISKIADNIKNEPLHHRPMAKLWRPIEELEDKYSNNLLLCAPELVDLDCNECGIGMGYWQDDRDVPCGPSGAIREPGVDYGGFLACKWNMTNDEWYEEKVTPTHFIQMEGPPVPAPDARKRSQVQKYLAWCRRGY